MKKIIVLFLAVVMLFSLVACGKAADTDKKDNTGNSTNNATANTGTTDTSEMGGNSEMADAEEVGLTEKISIVLAHDYSPNSANDIGMAWYAEEVNARSGGMIEIDVFGNGELSGSNSQVTAQLLQAGDIDMAITAPPTTAVRPFIIYTMPFLFKNAEQALAVSEAECGQMLLDAMQDAGMQGLGFCSIGMREYTNNVRPFVHPEDMVGLKMRCLEGKTGQATYAAYNAIPIATSMSELYMSLQQGAVDGQENPCSTIKNKAFNEVQKYLSITDHVWSYAVFGANADFWNNLPEAAQKILKETAVDACRKISELAPAKEQEALDWLIEQGMEVNYLTDEEKDEWLQASLPIYQAMEEDITTEVMDAFFKELGIEKNW